MPMSFQLLATLFAAAAVASSLPAASGFILTTATTKQQSSVGSAAATFQTKSRRRFRMDPINVIIYGWDGEIEEDDTSGSTFLDLDVPPTSTASSPSNVLLAERITQDRDRTASLARLAAAFSPPERDLNVEHITDVSVVDVTHTHIELAAMVCDGTSEGCVSLFVPVNFKQECPPVGFEDDGIVESCIRSNIDALDVDAELALLEKKAKKASEEGGMFGIYGDSLSTPDDFRP